MINFFCMLLFQALLELEQLFLEPRVWEYDRSLSSDKTHCVKHGLSEFLHDVSYDYTGTARNTSETRQKIRSNVISRSIDTA